LVSRIILLKSSFKFWIEIIFDGSKILGGRIPNLLSGDERNLCFPMTNLLLKLGYLWNPRGLGIEKVSIY
jgi:hypothetical protein